MAKVNTEVKAPKPAVVKPEAEVPKKTKIKEEFFAGKKIVKKFKREGGEFVVLDSGEEIKL
jgi:hypothetical protein